MIENILQDIGKIIVFLLLFLGVFLTTIKQKKQVPNRFFALFIWTTAIDMSGLFLGEFFNNHPNIHAFKTASVLIQMPCYFLYVKAICYYNFKLEWKQVFHAIPFISFSLWFLINESNENSIRIYEVFSQIQYYWYIGAVVYVLIRFRKLKLENYGFHSSLYSWLMSTTILFLTGNCLVVFRTFLGHYLTHETLTLLNFSMGLFALSVVSWFVLKTMKSPELFSGIDKNLQLATEKTDSKITINKEALQFLDNYMKTNKPYIEYTLSLAELAVKTDIPEKQISQMINHQLGIHFFDYINGFRIEEAKTLLKTHPELTAQEIMYRVGFNSKSSFYTAFKKATSLTPLGFRKTAI